MNKEAQISKALRKLEKASAPMTLGELMAAARVPEWAASVALGRLKDHDRLQMEVEWAGLEWGRLRAKETMVIRYSVKKGEDVDAA